MLNLQKPASRVSTLTFKQSLLTSVLVAVGLWWILIVDELLSLGLTSLGVYPGDMSHLAGVLVAPLIHGSWIHLVSNTLPLVILLTAAIYRYPSTTKWVLPLTYLLSGFLVWWFGREAFHFGASGITHGLMFFLFISGIIRRDKPAIAISLGTFFLYGGMIWSIFPDDPSISYEYHFFGALAGVLGAFLFKNSDKPTSVKKYEWEGDDEYEDPIIGDEWKLENEDQK